MYQQQIKVFNDKIIIQNNKKIEDILKQKLKTY